MRCAVAALIAAILTCAYLINLEAYMTLASTSLLPVFLSRATCQYHVMSAFMELKDLVQLRVDAAAYPRRSISVVHCLVVIETV